MTEPNEKNTPRFGQRGQSFMELAISLMFLLTLVAAVVEMGWSFYTLIAMRDAATEAASFGAICPNRTDLVQKRFFQSSTAPIAMDNTSFQMCIINPVGSDPTACIAPEIGYSISVTVTRNHEIITPFIGSFIGRQSFPLSVRTVNTVLRTSCPVEFTQ